MSLFSRKPAEPEPVVPEPAPDPVAPTVPAEPGQEWWWAAWHGSHIAFYLRTFMIGDFAPGQRPLDRHTMADPRYCRGCAGRDPVPVEELRVVERLSGMANFLDDFRAGRKPWPPPTNPDTCWYCSNPRKTTVNVRGRLVCAGCIAHDAHERKL